MIFAYLYASLGIAPIAKLYLNDGTGNFTEETGTPFEGVGDGSIAFSDVNGGCNSDVLIIGKIVHLVELQNCTLTMERAILPK